MKKIIFFCYLILILGCNKKSDKYAENTTTKENVQPKISYTKFLANTNNKTTAEKKKHFFSYINNEIPDYWIGTPWTFNGTTRIPQTESIACGYFVTNVLTDYGFKIDRTYLAQQASSVMIKKLCTDIHYFSDRKKLEDYIHGKEKRQVYIVGLDFHTGFITRENLDTYFIHSSYIKNKGVTKEPTSASLALNASKTYMIGTLNY
jgi:hypothetical protein